MRTWLHAAAIAGGPFFAVLAARSAGGGHGSAWVWAAAATGEPGQAGQPGQPGEPGRPGQPGEPGRQSSSGASIVSRSGNSCAVTLGGNATAHVLGTTFSIEEIRDGRATLRVEEQHVSGAPGETVSAGSLKVRFTAVTEENVSFSASLD